jgi:RNA recognition motif-containing protein
MATESNVEPTKVFVEGLPTGVKEALVRDMFEGYGEIAELNIVRCQGKNLPFATITYQTVEAATAAIDDCSDRRIKGYSLSVMPLVTDFAKRKEDKVNMLLLTELSPTVNPA